MKPHPRQVLKWYEVRDEYKGQDLCADAQIVDALAAIRATVVDRAGDFVDLLAPPAPPRPDGLDLPPQAAAAVAAGALREPPTGHGVTFAMEAGMQGLHPCQVHHIAPGSPAHIFESLRFGDEVRPPSPRSRVPVFTRADASPTGPRPGRPPLIFKFQTSPCPPLARPLVQSRRARGAPSTAALGWASESVRQGRSRTGPPPPSGRRRLRPLAGPRSRRPGRRAWAAATCYRIPPP